MLSFWLRHLILWGCRLVGMAYSVLRKPVVLNLVILAAIAGALWLVDRSIAMRFSQPAGQTEPSAAPASSSTDAAPPPNSSPAEATKQGKETGEQDAREGWLTPWKVLSIWAFGLVVWWVVRARRRLVISKFEDHADNKSGIDAGGFGILVATELARLSELFSEFEEGRSIQSIPEKLEPIDAAFQAEGAGGFLQNTVSAESKFVLWHFEIPIGAILNLVDQLVRGPRLTGQLHRDDGQRVITIRLEGSLGDRTWSIRDQALVVVQGEPEKVTWRPASELAREVAYRLFAELALGRSVTWEALSHFVGGLRAYRQCLQIPRRRQLNLKDAEHALIHARAEDPNCDLVYYNLGVVYTELGKLEAAEAAFARALKKNNQRRSTYYALALVNNWLARSAFQRGESEAAKLHLSHSLDLCDQALNLSPSAAEAAGILSLKALVLWWRASEVWADLPALQELEFRRSGIMSRRAIRKAWQALCWTELGFGVSAREKLSALKRARGMASRQLQNYASALLEVVWLQALRPLSAMIDFLDTVKMRQRVAQVPQAAELLTRLRNWEQIPGLRARAARAMTRWALRGLTVSSWGSEMTLWSRKMSLRFSNPRVRRCLTGATYALRQASSLTPAETSIYIDLGKTYIERRRFKDAVVPLRTAARLAPTSSDPWGFLALAYARLDRHGRAEEASERVLAHVSGASRESLSALLETMGTSRRLYAQIEEYAAALPQDKEMLQAPFFRRWLRRHRRNFCRRLAGHDRRGLKEAKKEFDELLDKPDLLRKKIDIFDNARKRIVGLMGFDAEIEALSRRGEEGVAPLKSLFSEKQTLGHNWEVGEIGEKLGGLYLDLGRLPEAKECLDQTIDHLEQSIPGEIQRRHLYVLLARILREQGNPGKALEQAKIGVARNPVASYERNELGFAYDSLKEYVSAQSVWEDALLLDPENPALHVNLGLAHLRQMEDSKDRTERKARLEAAVLSLKTALELYEDTDRKRYDARFLLSLVYSEAGDYPHTIRELRALDRRDYCHLAVALYLAEAYLDNADCAEAEHRFRKTAADADKLIGSTKEGPNEVVETPYGAGDMVLGTVSAWAHLGIASALAEREVFPGRAHDEVQKARDAIRDLHRANLKEDWAGRCTFFEGVILTKLGRIDEAIAKLETALEERTDAQSCFALANALARKAELTADPAGKMEPARRALHYYEATQRLDWNGALEAKVSKAIAQLQPVK